MKRAAAQLEEARVNKGFTRIAAPYAGIITEKKMEPGSMAAPGTPLLVIEDTSHFRVDAYVNERLLPKVRAGMPVTVVPAGDGARLTGTIGEVVPAVDPATRSFPVKVYLKEPSLRSGLYVRIVIPEGTKKVLLVPKGAVVEKGELTGVYVVDDQGVMTYRIIKTGQPYGDEVEVVSGLTAGERIVVGGLEHAVDGGLVRTMSLGIAGRIAQALHQVEAHAPHRHSLHRPRRFCRHRHAPRGRAPDRRPHDRRLRHLSRRIGP